MKKLHLIMFILSITGYSLEAQNWFPIGATWHYNIPSYMGTLGGGGAIKIEVVKDTTINNTPCKILSHLSYNGPNDSVWEKNIYAHERNDSVYFLRNDTFLLTYDLSQPLGDSITMRLYYDSIANVHPDVNCWSADTTLRFHIDSSGVINQNGQTLRYYFAFQSATPEIIEKIGSTQFIYPYYNCIIDWAMPQLTCYSDSVLGLYQVDSTMPCLSFLTSVNNVSNLLSIELFPNPVSDHATISSGGNLIGSWLELKDAVGNCIFTQQINSAPYRLQTSALANGIYFVEVNSVAGVMRKRLVKM